MTYVCLRSRSFFFFFNDTATTEIYTLSLHDALPILQAPVRGGVGIRLSGGNDEPLQLWRHRQRGGSVRLDTGKQRDRKSTRLNSSHLVISYAVFCLKKKKLYIKPAFATEPMAPPPVA